VIRAFLNKWDRATSIDLKKFDALFPEGLKRADFLLFEDEVICESKEILAIDVEKQVAKLAPKRRLPRDMFNRYFCNSIISALQKANEQIADTRIALACGEALGLVVLENCIPAKLSALTLLSAADQSMLQGLPAIDGILCLDLTNFFQGAEGDKIRLCQLLLRPTERSESLSKRVSVLMQEFCFANGIPLKDGFTVERADQLWHAVGGAFNRYTAELIFK
jgi:hypothetical protein